MNEATRDAVIRRIGDAMVQLLHQQRQDRVVLNRVDDLASGVALRALLIYGLTGVLSGMFGTLLGLMVWRAIA